MEIIRKTETVKIEKFYVGNKEFLSEKEATEYINNTKKLLNREYYEVIARPDLTEGRGYYEKVIISIPKFAGVNTVYQYLFEKYGLPLSFVQGVSPIARYIVSEKKTFNTIDELNKFLTTKHKVGIGDYSELKELEVIYVNEKGMECVPYENYSIEK